MPHISIPTFSFSLPPTTSFPPSLSPTLSTLAPRYFKAVIYPNLKKKNLLVCSLAGFIFEEHHIWSFNQNAKRKNSPLKASHGPSLSKVDIVIRNEKGDVVQMCQLKCCATKRTCIEKLTNEKYAGMQRVGSYEVKRFNILDRVKIGEVESDATTYDKMIEMGNEIKKFMGKDKKRKNNLGNINLKKSNKKKMAEAVSNLVETRAQTKLRKEREKIKNLQLKNKMKEDLYRKKNDELSELIWKDQEERKNQMNNESYIEKQMQNENGIMDQGMIINSDEDDDYYKKNDFNIDSNSHLLSKNDNESQLFLNINDFIKENVHFFETSLQIEKHEEKIDEKKSDPNDKKSGPNDEIALIFEKELKQKLTVQSNNLNEKESEINSMISEYNKLPSNKTKIVNEPLRKKESKLQLYERPPFPLISKTKNENVKEKTKLENNCFKLANTDISIREEQMSREEKSNQSKVRAMEKLKKYESPIFD